MIKYIILFALIIIPLFALENLKLEDAKLKLLNNLEVKISDNVVKQTILDIQKINNSRFGQLDIEQTVMNTNDAGNIFVSKLKSRQASFGDFGFSEFDGTNPNILSVTPEDFSNNRKFYTTQFDNIIFVKDTRDNKTKQVSKEDFDNYDYYVGATKGQVAVRDTRDNSTKNVSKEDFDKFDYYQAFCKGKVNVIDTRDNKTKQVTKEDFDKFEYYQSVLIGQVTVLDTRDGKKKNVSKEDYNKFSFYQSLMRNRITAIDTRTGINVSISKEDFDNNEYYISSRSKKINIYDSKGVLQFETWGNFKKVCERENLPAFTLAESNRHNGKPIPLSNSKKGKTRLISSGFEKQIGWFAKEIEK